MRHPLNSRGARTLVVRIMAGSAVLGWLGTGALAAAGGWSAAVTTERRLGAPIEERWAGRDEAGLVVLAVAAEEACPRGQTLMVVTDQPVGLPVDGLRGKQLLGHGCDAVVYRKPTALELPAVT